MPIYVDTLPQKVEKTKVITLLDLVKVLPNTIPYPIDIWIGSKLARYGKTTHEVVFLTDSAETPSDELVQFFNTLVTTLELKSTLLNARPDSTGYRNVGLYAVRLYDKGELILDKETGQYTRLPSPSADYPLLTTQMVIDRLPKEIPFTQTVYLTGSIVRHGWSNNDADFIFEGEASWEDKENLNRIFMSALGWKTHVGDKVMAEREPVYLYKLYEGGKCLLQQ